MNRVPRESLKLDGRSPPLWRIRVGEYRIMYSVSDDRADWSSSSEIVAAHIADL